MSLKQSLDALLETADIARSDPHRLTLTEKAVEMAGNTRDHCKNIVRTAQSR